MVGLIALSCQASMESNPNPLPSSANQVQHHRRLDHNTVYGNDRNIACVFSAK